MAKRADFTIEPDLMKGEIDEHGQREPLVRLPGEPDHLDLLSQGRRLWSATIILGARLGDAWSLLAVVKPQRTGPGGHRPKWACSRARACATYCTAQTKPRKRRWIARSRTERE
jgi:hypothetical protein